MIKTEIGFTTPDAITVRGLDLAGEVLGKLEFVDMVALLAMKRLPTEPER
jgi:citrate synthase